MRSRGGYTRHTAWRRYQRFFPPELQLTRAALPEEEWWPWRGLTVHLDRYPGPGAVKVLLLHGAGGYSRLLAPLALGLRALGHEVLAPDLPGYGLTWAPPPENDWVLWRQLVVDLADAERRRDGRPVALFGASIGGPLALHAAGDPQAQVAGIAATMLLDPRDRGARAVLGPPWAPARAADLLAALPRALDGLRVPIALLANVRAIANDRELARLCARDRLGGGNRVPLRLVRSLLTARPPLEPEAFDRCPVLLAHPGQDRWTPLEHSLRVFDRLPAPKRLVVLEGCGHFPVEEPGRSQLQDSLARFLAGLERSS